MSIINILWILLGLFIAIVIGASIGGLILFIRSLIIKWKVPKTMPQQVQEAKLIKKEVENARESRRHKRIAELPSSAGKPLIKAEVKRIDIEKPVIARPRVQIPRPNSQKPVDRTVGEVKPTSKWDWASPQ